MADAKRARKAHTSIMISKEASDLKTLSNSLESLVAQVAPGVVTVKAAAYRPASGIILPNKLIAVANHTVRRSDRIPVLAFDGSTGEASILGRDEGLDLAILKAGELAPTPLEHADPGTLKTGMLAAVVGMTADVGPSASLGVLGAAGEARRTWRGGMLSQFLRLDVNLYPSQSGGAVVTVDGQLIGMATPVLSRHSAIAIPALTLARIAGELLREGRIRHGYIGVGVQPVAIQPSVLSRLDIEHTTGLMLLSVEDGSPADEAGLQLGDILLEIEGQAVQDSEELQAVLSANSIGKELRLKILSGGDVETRTLMVGERPGKGR